MLTSVPLEWFLGSSDIDLSAGGLTPSTASSAPPAAASATDPAAAATAARCSERIQQRTASQPSQTCLDAAAAPPAARRRRRGRSTKSAKTAKTAKTGTAPLKPRPSALKRRVGAGLKGRPRNGEGFPWHVPAVQKRMRQLKDLYLAGKLTQTVRGGVRGGAFTGQPHRVGHHGHLEVGNTTRVPGTQQLPSPLLASPCPRAYRRSLRCCATSSSTWAPTTQPCAAASLGELGGEGL